jgi:hypothetical protein
VSGRLAGLDSGIAGSSEGGWLGGWADIGYQMR